MSWSYLVFLYIPVVIFLIFWTNLCFPNVIINVYSWILNIFTVEFCLCWWLNLLVWLVVPSQTSFPCFKWWYGQLICDPMFSQSSVILLLPYCNNELWYCKFGCIVEWFLAFLRLVKKGGIIACLFKTSTKGELLHALLWLNCGDMKIILQKHKN